MGTYCELYIADYPVFSSKSQASPLVMTLFRERDKKVFDRKCAYRNQIEWGHADWDPTETERVVEYSASVREVRDRLRVMGFTLSRAKAEFDSVKAEYLDELRELNEESDLWDEEIAVLERCTFSDFLRAFREIVTSGLHPIHFSKEKPNASKLAVYVLKDREVFYWGFPCRDIRSFFRALLEVVPESALVMQDLTDLVSAGYYGEADRVCEKSLEELKGDYSVNSRIILLTEGPTDSEVLRASIDLLFPHLSDYYSFMDLAARAPGGTGSLVHVVKSLAGAGIENRTIALFDNDAGHSAAILLRHVRLPHNILVMNYPNNLLACSYPTCGPNGEAVQDVNGSACSIELYFGRDVLTNDGRLFPVHWKGYDEKVKRYQGEIEQKDLLKERFLQKVDTAKRSGLQPLPGDWKDMRQLLESVFDAFNAQQGAPADRPFPGL
jgi:HEPN/Toprim N-terminal domain 1